ncbi:MAG TPA: TIGR03087 family PEP-CTERM/XrtA system glycosyltransferase [Candidatus Acidoferrales bacterium]|nr:TIGR03087 family PEP-CTERM/XrtA system glycosyltransferase [Candidatus Acidoferrales bacterium]
MRILFLAHRIPYPPNKGDKIRSYHLLRSLAERHEVSLLCWADRESDRRYEPVLRALCRGGVEILKLNPRIGWLRGLGSLLAGRSFSEGYFFSRRFQRRFDLRLEKDRYDLIYAFSAPMARYVPAGSPIPLLMDFVDVDSLKWTQLASFKPSAFSRFFLLEGKRLARYEMAVAARAKWSLFVSPAEAQLFRSQGASGNILALPNGVDFDLFRLPVEADNGSRAPASRPSAKPLRLIFTGTMNYFPNVDAVLHFSRRILPLIRREYPDVVFDIVGRCPTRPVRRLARSEGIRVAGEVADIREHLVRADVSVAPLRLARGVQNKILEAMAMGIPVVATPEAVEGLEVEPGEELLVGESPEAFARQVVALLREPRLRAHIAKRARARVVQHYSWKRAGLELEAILNAGGAAARLAAGRAL